MHELAENAKKDMQIIDGISLLSVLRLEVPWSKEGIEGLDELTYKTHLHQRCANKDLECIKRAFSKSLVADKYYMRYFSYEEIFQEFDLWLYVEISHPTSWFEPLWNKGSNITIISKDLNFHVHATEYLNPIGGSEIQVFKGHSM